MGDSREHNQMGSSESMDDESGLELSLGLSCGGFGSKVKVKDALKETNSEQGAGDKVKNGKISGDTCMKVVLCGSTDEEDNEVKQSNVPVSPTQQNFWMNLGKAPTEETENSMEMHLNQMQFAGFREPWFAGETSIHGQDMSVNTEKAKINQQQRHTILNQQQELLEQQTTREISDQKWQEARKKRKMAVEEQTKGEKEDDKDDLQCKSNSEIPSQLNSSPISANTQDVPSPDNEDTSDSEVEASSSGIVSPMAKYNVKQPMPAGSDVSDKKENQIPVTRTIFTENEINKEYISTPFMPPAAIASTSLPNSLQSFNVGHTPYSHSIQVPNTPNVTFSAGFSLPYLMQFMPPTVNGADRSAVRPVNASGVQLPIGYAPFQLPALETSPSWVSVSHSHQPPIFGSKIVGGARKLSEHADDDSRISQAAVQAPQGSVGVRSAPLETAPQDSQSTKSLMKDERQLERTCSDTGGTSISSKGVDDDAKHGVAWSKENVNHLPMADGLSQEVGNLRPGIAPGLKFGGTGNLPDLPWVSTTGVPHGKTISGAMYRYNRSQVRIVCACHGRHMSPTEFVQHANDVDASNLDNNVVADSFPPGNQATSAQV